MYLINMLFKFICTIFTESKSKFNIYKKKKNRLSYNLGQSPYKSVSPSPDYRDPELGGLDKGIDLGALVIDVVALHKPSST